MANQSTCYHCGETISGKAPCFAVINGTSHPMCCPGCQFVAEAIEGEGLAHYYQYRTEQALKLGQDKAPTTDYTVYDRKALQTQLVSQQLNGQCHVSLSIEGITCAACIWLLEKHLNQLKGVEQASVNLTTHRAYIQYLPEHVKLSEIMQHIAYIGYLPHPFSMDKQQQLAQQEYRKSIRRLAVAGIGTMQVMMYAIALYAGALQGMEDSYRDFIRWVSFLLATPVVFYAAQPFFKAAWRDVKARHLSMDFPVATAIGAAYTASTWAMLTGSGEVYFDSVCMFTFFLLISRFLEMRARHHTTQQGSGLLKLLPDKATRIDDNSQEQAIAAIEVEMGYTLRIKPGEPVPADGVIIQGQTTCNEAMLTGEYLPVTKQVSDTVLAGTINVEHAIDIQVTATGQTTRLAHIVSLLEQAQQEKPFIAQLADRVASYFVTAVILIAAVVYSYWSQHNPADAFWITLAVLVVTCPCALSLATPTALTAAMGRLYQQGLLITGNHVLESLTHINHIIFDKTGTLTEGKLTLEQVIPTNSTLSPETMLDLIAALEAHSEHPIAKTFAERATPLRAKSVTNHPGYGIEGSISSHPASSNDSNPEIRKAQRYRVGKSVFICSWLNIPLLDPPEPVGQWLLFASEQEVLGWIKLADTLRQDSAHTIHDLQQQNMQLSLLSGDQPNVVKRVAETLSISSWQANMTPEDKLAQLQTLQQQGKNVLMVGDGINDVPILAAANVSVSLGCGSDLAKNTADIVLLNNQLNSLLTVFDIAKQTRNTIRTNLVWALSYNLVALPLAACGIIQPWMAAIGMASSSLLVVANALRLTRTSKCSTKQHLQTQPSQITPLETAP
ncbi:heavy metal translocating P-type ATPase [Zooshikella sp. WH53]|uniref:Heavy metal translocating P-type ATPase n=2 Tax=Zooshikella harenae TaxID=2827238 RepID=A0ABS5Z7T4_9GAMM|nr:heavy metal translocating P-type ATPase [Zooshikella harenae]